MWPELTSALLLALVGIELVALLPDTATIWWQGKPSPDFQLLLDAARDLKPNGLYSPGPSLLLHPLTLLDQANAYRVYTALGALAVVAVAYLAQRGIRPIEARVAAALGVASMPQMHWALRLGHLTPFLALAALGGFLLVRRRPYLAGLCFAFLILKPQYHVQWTSAEPVPAVAAIYEDLLKSGNWELMLREETSPSYRIRLSRLGPDGFMTHWAMLDVSPQEGGSRISLDSMITQGFTVTLN